VDHHSPNKEHAEIRKTAFKRLGLIFLGLLLAVNTIQLARLGGIVERVDQYNKGVVDELGGVRNDVMTFASDLNEIRSFLLLPVKQYSFSGNNTEVQSTDEQAASRTETAVYSFIGNVSEEKNLEKNAKLAVQTAQTVLNDSSFLDGLAKAGLSAGKLADSADTASFKISDNAAGPLFTFVIEKPTFKSKVQSAGGVYEIKGTDAAGIKDELLQYVTSHKDGTLKLKNLIASQKEALAALGKNPEIAKLLGDKKITLSQPEETDASINYNFANSDGQVILTVSIVKKDGAIIFKDKTYQSADLLLPDLIKDLQAADSTTAGDKMLQQRRTELEAIFSQQTFKDMIKDAGLNLVLQPRQENNKLIYDIKDSGGSTVFSYAIEISSGLFKVIKGDQEIDLYSALDDGSKKKP
jgi:hypothetical protein